jgi:hypothetical protein
MAGQQSIMLTSMTNNYAICGLLPLSEEKYKPLRKLCLKKNQNSHMLASNASKCSTAEIKHHLETPFLCLLTHICIFSFNPLVPTLWKRLFDLASHQKIPIIRIDNFAVETGTFFLPPIDLFYIPICQKILWVPGRRPFAFPLYRTLPRLMNKGEKTFIAPKWSWASRLQPWCLIVKLWRITMSNGGSPSQLLLSCGNTLRAIKDFPGAVESHLSEL